MTCRDDFKTHWFYTHSHLPTSQNGRTYPTQSASVRMRNHAEHSSLLFKRYVTSHLSISLNSHSHQVQHALKAWTTGEYVEPRGSANHFSADNYSDRTERLKSDNGRTVNVLVRRATQYMPTVKSLSKEHWVTIFAEISDILAL
jgi:hypothetical protein